MGRGRRQDRSTTLDFILEWTRDIPERQLKDAEYLNSKMIQVFSAATALVGLAGLSSPNPKGSSALHVGLVAAFLVAAIAAYVVVAVCGFIHLRNRDMQGNRQATSMWTTYFDDEAYEVKLAMVDVTRRASAHNETILNAKNRTLQVGVFAAGAEAILVGLALTAARLT